MHVATKGIRLLSTLLDVLFPLSKCRSCGPCCHEIFICGVAKSDPDLTAGAVFGSHLPENHILTSE